jgi:hypothetical protein
MRSARLASQSRAGIPSNPAIVANKTTQTVNAFGNVAQAQVFDFGNLTAPARTYNYTYLTDSGYLAKYIRNRLTSATVTSSQGTITLVGITYDNYGCAGNLLRSQCGRRSVRRVCLYQPGLHRLYIDGKPNPRARYARRRQL